MIRPLRSVHRWLLPLIGIASIAMLVAALAARQTHPTSKIFPFDSGNMPAADAVFLSERTLQLAGTSVQARRFADGVVTLEGEPGRPLAAADILVYWNAGEGEVTRLPDGAVLLGQFDGSRRSFEAPNAARGGQLLFYSLANHELLATTWTPDAAPATNRTED